MLRAPAKQKHFCFSVLQFCNLQAATLKHVSVLLYYSGRKTKTQHAPARCCLPVPVTLKSKLDFVFPFLFFFGDATGGCAVCLQRQDSCVTDRRDITGEKNSEQVRTRSIQAQNRAKSP